MKAQALMIPLRQWHAARAVCHKAAFFSVMFQRFSYFWSDVVGLLVWLVALACWSVSCCWWWCVWNMNEQRPITILNAQKRTTYDIGILLWSINNSLQCCCCTQRYGFWWRCCWWLDGWMACWLAGLNDRYLLDVLNSIAEEGGISYHNWCLADWLNVCNLNSLVRYWCMNEGGMEILWKNL